jgi:hypothetical protein
MKKKTFQNLLLAIAIAMAGICATQTASAQTISFDIGTVSASTADYSYGIDGYGHNVVTLTTNGGSYVITGNTTSNLVKVRSGINVSITLNGVDINVSAISDACAFDIDGATVSLTLQGTNTLKSGYNRAGINVPTGAALTIGGNGTLNTTGGATGAGIGSNAQFSRGSYCGSVTITGGTVNAEGGGSAAGIGGGMNSNGGYITIDGGTVNASGGGNAAGIGGGDSGGGGTVIITGVTVIATGSDYGAGIGGGSYYGGGYVTINGGTVVATGGSRSAGIGGGYNSGGGTLIINGGSVQRSGGGGNYITAKNSNGDLVYLSTLTVGGSPVANTAIAAGTIGGITCETANTTPDASTGEYGIYDVSTDDDGKVYFWLPASGSNRSILLTAGSNDYYANVTANANNDNVATLTLAVPAAPSITTASLPGGTVGTPYSQTVTADGYPTPTLSISGTLPTGLSFNTSTGLISGTPTSTSGSPFTINITATNSQGSDSESFTITIAKGAKAAPTGLTSTAVSSTGASDGTISGLTTDMEYKPSSDPGYTACTGTTISMLVAGDYYVRYKETANYLASTDTMVTVASPDATVGDFYVSFGSGNYSYASNTLTITANGTYTITMASSGNTTTTDKIVVQSGLTAVNITLDNVSIDLSGASGACAFNMDGAIVNLTLQGTNTLKSGENRAGIYVPTGAALTITGTGTLNAYGGNYGAGIGGTYATGWYENCGSVTITGGTVNVTGGSYAAGIGCGYNGYSGSVTITGGTVNATGGTWGEGIGGVSGTVTVTINGGTVNAMSIIGGLIINGGSVKANDMSYTRNDNGDYVYLSTLTVGNPPVANTEITAGAIGA